MDWLILIGSLFGAIALGAIYYWWQLRQDRRHLKDAQDMQAHLRRR